jgi:hypothetical protein
LGLFAQAANSTVKTSSETVLHSLLIPTPSKFKKADFQIVVNSSRQNGATKKQSCSKATFVVNTMNHVRDNTTYYPSSKISDPLPQNGRILFVELRNCPSKSELKQATAEHTPLIKV